MSGRKLLDPTTYTTKTSNEEAQELNNIHVTSHHKMATLGIKDLYINLPIRNKIKITKFSLNKENNETAIIKQTLNPIKVTLNQNYFQYDNKYFHPTKGIISEIYLQFFEELFIKYWIENGEISYHKRYVDDILIIFNPNKINEKPLLNHMNSIHKHLEFKITEEENGNINCLDLTIHRHNNKLNIEIYRKPTQTDVNIYFTVNHPFEQILAAFIFYINRMITVPITEQAKQQKWNTILTIAKNNRFPLRIIHNLKNKLITKHNILSSYKHTKREHIRLLQSTYTQNN